MTDVYLSRSGFIHLVRWVSAVLVAMNHLRSLVFKDFRDISSNNLFIKAFYFLTSLGHEAVIVFFVLSGYLITSSVINQINKNKFSVKEYFIKRAARLYSVLFIALLFTSLFDFTGNFFDKTGIYHNSTAFATLNFSVMDREDFSHFITSFFMLQTIILPPLGSNAALWSLSYEFWYYVLFPFCCVLVFPLFKKQFNFSLSITALVVLILTAIIITRNISTYYIIWLVGLMPLFLNLKSRILKYVLFVIIGLYLVVGQKQIITVSPWLSDFSFAILFATWIASFNNEKKENYFYKFNERLAGFSYSLYLLHFPFMLLLLTLLFNYQGIGFKMVPSGISFLLFFLILISSILFSAFIAHFTEHKTNRVRAFFNRMLPS